ncbi:unnamed protein product, partial [Mesorhabditis belari]|uniref:Uncharacterized protein n=1 Tax=Mesorhabditis belari TaxID=2138241 RepID=A0AAF3ET42_9BILA
MSRLTMTILLVLGAIYLAQADTTATDIVEEVKSLRPFELKHSSLGCPLPVVGASCPEETPFYYFKCCGDLAQQCCFRLQEWVVLLLIVLAVLVVISIVVNLIRCLCCY